MPDTPAPTATDPRDPLDAELRRIATALVAEAPEAPRLRGRGDGAGSDGHVTDLVLTRNRPPARGRRVPRLAAVAAAATVALVAGGVIAVTGDDDPTEDRYGFLAQAGLEPAPQRLIYDDWQHELTADGQVVPLELDGLDPNGPPRPLPDGGHVVVGVHAIPADEVPEDFNEFTDLTFELAVVGADGEVEIRRDLGNEESMLVGVTSSDAILYRQPQDDHGRVSGPASVVAHDLATGEERVVHQDVSFDPNSNAWARWAVVGADLVTVAAIEHLDPGGSTPLNSETVECVLRVTDLTTGEDHQQRLDLPCYQVMGVQASPDGSRVAVVYENDAPDVPLGATYLAAIDLPGGEVVHDELIGQRVDCSQGCSPGTQPIEYHGIAWDDAATVRVALTDTTSPPGELVVKRIAID